MPDEKPYGPLPRKEPERSIELAERMKIERRRRAEKEAQNKPGPSGPPGQDPDSATPRSHLGYKVNLARGRW